MTKRFIGVYVPREDGDHDLFMVVSTEAGLPADLDAENFVENFLEGWEQFHGDKLRTIQGDTLAGFPDVLTDAV